MRVDVAFKLISSNEMLATFPIVFIVKIYNNLSERFTAEMVWAWPTCVKLNPLLHYGNVKLRSECKANWGGSNSVVHSNEISNPRPQEWDPCTSSPKPSFQLSVPALVLRRRGLMSHLAKRMEVYLGISSTLVFRRHCFLPGLDWEQKRRRCVVRWIIGYCSCVLNSQTGLEYQTKPKVIILTLWIVWGETG